MHLVVNAGRHGAELGGDVPRRSFDLVLIPSLNFVTTKQIKHKYLEPESVLTF